MDILTTRQQEIVSILNEKEQLSVNDLAEHFPSHLPRSGVS